jgi:cytochrome oxidase Cu insertion factor (SCO1/SenC/PrrC family)
MMRLALLLLAAIGWAQTPLSPSDLNRVAPGVVAPDFELPSAEGGKLKLSSLRGRNVVLLFYRGFW